ncbi:hypothetical protein G6011_05887 [Alternaria panax]|uniref:Uncharacterized protein n=1 Tax=Alternaria panax TaxID=48097 RepID=A0AAD4FKE7_9PLEO|nr:hypothetical protein G6011_05887 [Alternaria panax]
MPGFLDLPLELRNHVYELLLSEELGRSFRGVMVVSEHYVRNDLPLRCYRGLLRVCRQTYGEFKQAVQHLVAAKRLNYEFDITFSHGRPYFSLSWVQFAALSPTINQLVINVDLRTREPLRDGPRESFVPHEHELAHLLEHSPTCFAKQLFDYIAIFLKTLANLLFQGNPHFSVLYTERMIINLRTPTKVVTLGGNGHNPITLSRRLRVDQTEARKLHNTMRNTLQITSNSFKAFDANNCDQLFPLIQIGSLRFATEGQIWGEGHNLVLAHDDFQWLRY